MHLRTLLIAAALLIGATGAKAQSTKVDDFESQFSVNMLGGYWYFYDDRTDSGSSVITTADTATLMWDSTTFAAGAEGSASALKLGWRFGAKDPKCGGTCTYPPMVGMGTKLATSGGLDLTGATAITFWAKADAPAKTLFSLGTSEVKDNGKFAKLITITTSWTKYTVSLAGSDLKQPSWAKQVAFNPKECVDLAWSVSKGDNAGMAGGAVYLDHIAVSNWEPPVEPISVRRQQRRIAPGFLSERPGDARVDALGRDIRAAAVKLH